MQLKLLLKSESKMAEVTDDLIGNKIADKMTKVSRNSPENSLKVVESRKLKIEIYQTKDMYIHKKTTNY